VTPPADVTDPNLNNNSATDTDAVQRVADLAITKTDGWVSMCPGTSTAYTIVVSNLGPSDVSNVPGQGHFAALVTSDSWTATATGGANGFTPGQRETSTTRWHCQWGTRITTRSRRHPFPAATGTR